MPQSVAVINVVALSKALIGEHTPHLKKYLEKDAAQLKKMVPSLPAVTTTVQSSMVTGKTPGESNRLSGHSGHAGHSGHGGHGIVANGWYNREASEVQFWKQSNKLVAGKKVWEIARDRDPSVTTMNMFWWYNMYSSADYSVTPRPIYKADGRKLPDCYAYPAELRDELQAELGQFPLFHFWGPMTSIRASSWIADAAKFVWEKKKPTLSFIYLPHLDYGLQKYGVDLKHPVIQKDLKEIDEVVHDLVQFFESRDVRPIILSEYAIETVDLPIYINRTLRKKDWLKVRVEEGLELLDAGASQVFAVADHQVAHVYVHENSIHNSRFMDELKQTLEGIEGVESVLDEDGKKAAGIDHPRSGEFVLVAREGAWFSYPYWLDDAKAPDFARTVDIHRKPGYDPAELFIDPKIPLPKLKLAWRLFQKKILKQRCLMDVIPLDASIVKGSHGRVHTSGENYPVVIAGKQYLPESEVMADTQVHDLIMNMLFD